MTTKASKAEVVCQTEVWVCPWCKKPSEVGRIRTDKVEVLLCSGCHKCWMVLNGKIERLQRMRHLPETDIEFLLCPYDWYELQPDYDLWIVKCPNPICGFEKRMQGLSIKQIEAKKCYMDLKRQIFEDLSNHKPVPTETMERLAMLRVEYQSMKHLEMSKQPTKKDRGDYLIPNTKQSIE